VLDVYRAEIVHPIYENCVASDTKEGSPWVDIHGDSLYHGPVWSRMDSQWMVVAQHKGPQINIEGLKGLAQMEHDIWYVC
jgi:hypothetical protein